MADRLLRSRLVRCPNQPLGCTAPPLSLERCQEHLFGECLFRTVQCPHCKKPQSAATLLAHTERCFERCAACGVATPRADAGYHALRLCLAAEHPGWRSAAEASDFARCRDRVRQGALGWLVRLTLTLTLTLTQTQTLALTQTLTLTLILTHTLVRHCVHVAGRALILLVMTSPL